jgi:hypothetical protein
MAERASRWSNWEEDRQQHVEPHRKYLLRRHLIRWAPEGAVYAPFCGDADIAIGHSEDYRFPGLYEDRFICACDLEEARTKVASSRIPDGIVKTGDCEEWMFSEVERKFAIADFDAWSNPYNSFRAFWENAEKTDRIVMYFTDALKMRINGDGWLVHPDGSKRMIDEMAERRRASNFYLSKHVWPWFDSYVKPYRVIDRHRFIRGMLVYWGVALQREVRSSPKPPTRRTPMAAKGKGKISNFKGKKAAPFKAGGGRRKPKAKSK